MKRLISAAAILGMLLIAAPSMAQQKLGDVAGSIKINRPEGEAVVIDGSDIGQTSRRSSASSDADLMYEILADCLDAARTLSTMVADAPRITPVTYSSEWRGQLDDIGQRLESMSRELQRLPDAASFEAAYQKAVAGLDEVRQGFDSVLTTVNARRLVVSADKRQISNGADTIEEAMTEVRAVGRSQAAKAPPPAIDPVAAAASIRKVCSSQGAEGSQAYRDCVNLQDAAKDALVARTAPSVGLDTASFNKIRNGCLYEWPDNYFSRDACEVRRSAAKAGG
jgi:hypothetical protein